MRNHMEAATAKNIAHFTTFILTEGARPAGPPSSKTEHWRRTASCLEDPFTIASEEGENDAIARAVGNVEASSIKIAQFMAPGVLKAVLRSS